MVSGLTFQKDMVIVSTSNESPINSSDQLSHTKYRQIKFDT